AAVAEPFGMEHVERDGASRHTILRREGEPRLAVDEMPDQPRGRAAVDAGPRPRHPYPAFVVFRIDLDVWAPRLGRTRAGRLVQPFPDAFLKRAVEKIDFNDLLKAIPQPFETASTLPLLTPGRKRLQHSDQSLIFPRSRFREAADQLRP